MFRQRVRLCRHFWISSDDFSLSTHAVHCLRPHFRIFSAHQELRIGCQRKKVCLTTRRFPMVSKDLRRSEGTIGGPGASAQWPLLAACRVQLASRRMSRGRDNHATWGKTVAHKKTCEIRFEFTPDNFRTPPELFARLSVNNVMRILISAISISVAAFCVFGFLASFEPGVSVSWKIGYAILFGVGLLLALQALRSPN